MHEVFEADRGPIETLASPISRDELGYRLRQQSLLGEFGRTAMQTRDLRKILQRATELCAVGLQAPFVKVLEYQPDENRLMVRAGVGWAPGTIDAVSLAADIGSPQVTPTRPAPVISNHLEADTRFRTPQLLADHGVRRAINVLIEKGGEGKAFFGVLEVDSADPGQFDQEDANFLAGFAGLLGVAIERQQADAGLQAALKHQALLTREMSHRVKNSLTSVVGLLRVQARSAQSEDVKNALQDASLRVSPSPRSMIILAQFARRLRRTCGLHDRTLQKPEGQYRPKNLALPLRPHAAFRRPAIPLGLLINELVTNAIKYAYPEGCGKIEVSAREIDDTFTSRSPTRAPAFPKGSTSISRGPAWASR